MSLIKTVRAAAILALSVAGSASAAERGVLDSGLYEVEVKLELPHLEDMTGKKIERVCLSAEAGENNHGIAVLSDNNPLAKCPVSNVREDGSELTFDIACAGRNSAKAAARYILAPTAFRGRITMQMGGKNMTMTEVQTGHRTGACETGKTSAP